MSAAARITLARRRRPLGRALVVAPLVPLLALCMLIAIGAGAYELSVAQVAGILLGRLGVSSPWAFDAQQAEVLWAIRLPRVLLAATVGGALAASGAAMQGLFRNPLADPALIGISSGASLGAVFAIVAAPALLGAAAWMRLGALALPIAAFAGSLAATWLTLRVGRAHGRPRTTLMLLAGIAINALAGAGVGLAMHLGSDAQLRSLTFWLLGSLGAATWPVLATTTPLLVAGLAALVSVARGLDALLLGEREAHHLGVDVARVQRVVVVATALAVGASVAVTGVIGFVGLVVPHLVRALTGPSHRTLLPASMLTGASLLCLADAAARTLAAPSELPLGALTALLGAPVFLFQLRASGRAMELG